MRALLRRWVLGHRQDDSLNPPCHIGEVLDFFWLEGAVEDVAFAVGEPFLGDLVAAEFVGPDGGGGVLQTIPEITHE